MASMNGSTLTLYDVGSAILSATFMDEDRNRNQDGVHRDVLHEVANWKQSVSALVEEVARRYGLERHVHILSVGRAILSDSVREEDLIQCEDVVDALTSNDEAIPLPSVAYTPLMGEDRYLSVRLKRSRDPPVERKDRVEWGAPWMFLTNKSPSDSSAGSMQDVQAGDSSPSTSKGILGRGTER